MSKQKSEYKKHRLTVEEWRMIRQMRKEADVVILKKPAPLEGTIHVVVPEHYGAKGLIWISRFINERQLEDYQAQYPSMQILDEKYKVRRKEAEDAEIH